ncbi:zinc-binding alcohol dehydrogenase family protein [Paraburkholderia dinghuensis]|uniref:Zinc-binding alcohol dehydrogenase family protein n=2 Tax=Paraburkholderia dinghuensis TaxID=2305225 RepID=A0A3N6N395_9BURK|nr:zinc-binding alcohol dehydrogenase family protein [Paraburkholderia dinghuensis]
MRAAVIKDRGLGPVLQDFPVPQGREGATLINVDTAGLGGWDVLGAYRMGEEFPCVIRGEGVGHTVEGRRVYFGERSVVPFGAWAEHTLVPVEEVWDVPDDVDDVLAITMGIAGTGALLPLEQAGIKPGENVLILGATGTLGQIAIQLARILGAGRVVGAARNASALERLRARGLADAVVTLGGADDAAALKAAAGEGFDVVLDGVCGAPMLNALKATRRGARIVTIGTGAGREINLNIADLLFRTLSCVGTGQRPASEREATWRRLLRMAREHRITFDHVGYRFDQTPDAWAAQVAGPHAKITATIRA